MGFISDAVGSIPGIGGVAKWAVDPIGSAVNEATGVHPLDSISGIAGGGPTNNFRATAPVNGFRVGPAAQPAPGSYGYQPPGTPMVGASQPASGFQAGQAVADFQGGTPGQIYTAGASPTKPNWASALGVGFVPGQDNSGSALSAPAATTPQNYFWATAPTNYFSPTAFSASAPMNGFRAHPADLTQSDYGSIVNGLAGQTMGQGGPANGTIAAQGRLAGELEAQGNGQGPSIAAEQLKQATQQNALQAAGMIGSQRGINAGNATRQILNATAGVNQQAAGQSAITRLQEQLAARSMLGNVLSSQGGLQLGQQASGVQGLGAAGGLQNAQNAANIQNLGMAQGLNAQAALANQSAALGTLGINAQGYNLAQQLAAQTAAQNQAAQLAAMGINAGTAQQNTQMQQASNILNQQTAAQNAALNLGAQQINAGVAANNADVRARTQGALIGGAGAALGTLLLSGGGEVPPWEMDFRGGGHVPGRAAAKGDSPKNDTVTAKVSPGEIVVPRSIAQAPDAPEAAARFIAAIKAKDMTIDLPPSGYGRVLAMNREHEHRIRRLEALACGGRV